MCLAQGPQRSDASEAQTRAFFVYHHSLFFCLLSFPPLLSSFTPLFIIILSFVYYHSLPCLLSFPLLSIIIPSFAYYYFFPCYHHSLPCSFPPLFIIIPSLVYHNSFLCLSSFPPLFIIIPSLVYYHFLPCLLSFSHYSRRTFIKISHTLEKSTNDLDAWTANIKQDHSNGLDFLNTTNPLYTDMSFPFGLIYYNLRWAQCTLGVTD